MLPRHLFKSLFFALTLIILTLFFCPSHAAGPSATVILYEHSNFRGRSLTVTRAVTNLHAMNWGDRVSSLMILNGHWTFYVHSQYRGQSVTLGPGNYRRVTDVGFPNDALSSLKPH